MHQLSECLPTLPVVKKAENTVHPHVDQVRVRVRVRVSAPTVLLAVALEAG